MADGLEQIADFPAMSHHWPATRVAYDGRVMRGTLATLAAAALVMTVACSDSPQPPTTPSTPTTTTVTPTVPQVREVTIIGAPANVQIGKTAQLRAAARADDGIQDVTAQATWQSSDSGVCAVSSGGLVEGKGAGTATLTATYSGVTGTASLTCGFAITATVHENEPTTSVRLAGARVEVAGGPLDGRTFETDASGRVTLPPVAAPGFALYFKKQGYDDRRLEVFELPRQTALDVWVYREPVTQQEHSGSCGPPESRTIPFAVPRQGRMRLSVFANEFRPSSWMSASVFTPTQVVLSAYTVPSSVPGAAEVIVEPGDYLLYFSNIGCTNTPGATWRVQLEFPR
jgi:hypothetical protein